MSDDRKKVLLADVSFVSYRKHYYEELSVYYDFVAACTEPDLGSGFSIVEMNDVRTVPLKEQSLFRGKLLFQKGLFNVIREFKPQVIISGLGNRYLNQWLLLFYCKIWGIDLYIHGHGPYNKNKDLFLYRIIYRTILLLCSGFICYTRFSLDSFHRLGIYSGKLSFAENTLENEYPVTPGEKTYNESGILFIGRIREGSGLELLIESVMLINAAGYKTILHVIGDGDRKNSIYEKYVSEPSIMWHGKIYNQEKIAEISKNCFIGCYPGSVGLSVVHFFSLSLPAIIHDNIYTHGPEASYVMDKYNGLLFKNENNESLTGVIKYALENRVEIKKMGFNAYKDYLNRQSPSLAAVFYKIIEGNAVKQNTK